MLATTSDPSTMTTLRLSSATMDFYDITMTSITGDEVSFSDYQGQLVLVVNVASH